jgi:hypothetical protein
MGKMVGAGAEIFDKLEPEPHKNGPAPQHWCFLMDITENYYKKKITKELVRCEEERLPFGQKFQLTKLLHLFEQCIILVILVFLLIRLLKKCSQYLKK